MPDEPIALEEARSIAESMLGHAPDRIDPFRPAVGGDDSYAFRLRMHRDRMLLKVKKRSGSPIGVYFHGRIKEAGIPVPELVAFNAAGGPQGQACAVWEWIDGVPADWRHGQPCPYDEADLGILLRRVHDLEFGGLFGFLGDDIARRTFTSTPDMAPVSDTWSGMFLCDRAAERYLSNGYIDAHQAEVLASLPDRVGEAIRNVPKRLLHGSDIMHHGNILVSPANRRIVAVLDYVESLAGDPRWELAWFDYYFRLFPYTDERFDMARFRSAYGEDHDMNDPLGLFYLAAILLFEKLLFFRAGEARTEWAVETLRHILDEFGGQP